MELKDEFAGDNARLITCIRSLLELHEAGMMPLDSAARNMLTAAGARLAAAICRIAELEAAITGLEAENAGLALDKLTAPPAPDGITITRTEHSTDVQGFQHYSAKLSDGGKMHFYAVRVVKTLNADGPDAREADHFAAIERRLLAGNPEEV